ncbi:hypothetical protein ACHAWF_018712, partial [Thalassiosira exigua]
AHLDHGEAPLRIIIGLNTTQWRCKVPSYNYNGNENVGARLIALRRPRRGRGAAPAPTFCGLRRAEATRTSFDRAPRRRPLLPGVFARRGKRRCSERRIRAGGTRRRIRTRRRRRRRGRDEEEIGRPPLPGAVLRPPGLRRPPRRHRLLDRLGASRRGGGGGRRPRRPAPSHGVDQGGATASHERLRRRHFVGASHVGLVLRRDRAGPGGFVRGGRGRRGRLRRGAQHRGVGREGLPGRSGRILLGRVPPGEGSDHVPDHPPRDATHISRIGARGPDERVAPRDRRFPRLLLPSPRRPRGERDVRGKLGLARQAPHDRSRGAHRRDELLAPGGKGGPGRAGDGIVPTELAFMESPARRVEIERCSETGSAVRHAHVLPTPWNLIDGGAPSLSLPDDIVWYGSPGVLGQWLKYIE